MRFHCAGIALLSIALSAGLPMVAQSTAGPFYGPIRNNDLAGLRRLIQKSGANTGDARHTTPLMYAAALGSLDAVKMLVEAGAAVNTANDFGATPLMWCAGDLAKTRYLLSKGASVAARSKVGRTPLAIAAAYDGSVEIARLMIEKGADVKTVDESGASVLEIAASVNNLEVARLLAARGADVNTTDKDGFTALGGAVSAGDRSAERSRRSTRPRSSGSAFSTNRKQLIKSYSGCNSSGRASTSPTSSRALVHLPRATATMFSEMSTPSAAATSGSSADSTRPVPQAKSSSRTGPVGAAQNSFTTCSSTGRCSCQTALE